MYFWILVITIIQLNLAYSQDFPGEDIDDEGTLYYITNSKSTRSGGNDIETRRRSALDKNFMRFGRSGYNNNGYSYSATNDLDTDSPDKVYHRMRKAHLGKPNSFIRFGRAKGDFIRFGKSDPNFIQAKPTRANTDSYIRFGKRQSKDDYDEDLNEEEGKRFKRDTSNQEFSTGQVQNKQGRFDRPDRSNTRGNMIRFGRSDSNSNFMRFGRRNLQLERDQCKLLNENSALCELLTNPYLFRMQSFPIWPQPIQNNGEEHKNSMKRLNTIRFG